MSVSLFFFKQKTEYERRSSDWCSDVCSSDRHADRALRPDQRQRLAADFLAVGRKLHAGCPHVAQAVVDRDRAPRAGEDRDSLIGVRGIHYAAGLSPGVVADAVLPPAVTAIDGVLKLRTGFAVPTGEPETAGKN